MRKNENAWKNAMYNYSRFFVVCLVAFAMVFMSYPYSLYAAETASDTIVQEAKNESELLLSLRTALWLRYMDVRNAYTKDYKAWVSGGKVGAEPTPPGEFNTFTLSGLTGTYLPDSFPISDYSIATQGKELVLSKNISTATANIVPNFIPLAQITPATAEDSTVEFFVSRPGATAEFDMEEYVWKDRPNTMASPATLEWENWDTDLGAKTGVESFIAVNKTFLRTIEGANGSILSFGTPGVTSLTGDLDIANTLTATDGTFTTLQAATMDLTGDMDIDGTLTVANVDIQNKILSDMTLANDKEIKLDEGAVRLKASGTDLSVNNNEGYITMGRHGTQARFDTNADEFYFGKNIRVARLLGKADFATHADSASAANTLGGKSWDDIQTYVNNKIANSGSKTPLSFSKSQEVGIPWKSKVTYYTATFSVSKPTYAFLGGGSVYLRSSHGSSSTTTAFDIFINGIPIGSVTYSFDYYQPPYLEKTFSPYSNPVHLKPGTHTITAILRAVDAYSYAKNFSMTLYFID